MSHSPKPWISSQEFILSGSPTGVAICKTDLLEDIPNPAQRPSSKTAAANEALLCAAPELLEIVDTFCSLLAALSKKEREALPFGLQDLAGPATATLQKAKL